MKALFLLYEGFADFEINILGIQLRRQYEIVTTAAEPCDFVTGVSGLRFAPHVQLADVSVDDYDLLIIPGGDPADLIGKDHLKRLVVEFRRQDKWIAAICGGPVLLADAGVLGDAKFRVDEEPDNELVKDLFNWDNQVEEDVVITPGFITGVGSAYVEFAVAVAQQLGVIDEERAKGQLEFFKNGSVS
ncbi:4-methyl-5(b-hydroxyethyl)-thiazole monophosphate biosynthesis [Tumebacillus sp. BK434]|uniref:DJ-1/PfpI family protein n=1 Tax=Tumebacillus sp. BK434 TaxID=2512169 RepID=UPI0010DFDAA3|nr:DJ-1/PfpI family protein [Tumebacillus sp. BK434]TCP57972.1 4-methyl-5(b-hydroxyethyl)-thiazole monophosphate biosynthesis [Tumebacillus sp. BK434]